ncbi:MAG: hypothetical protein WB822_15755 [Rhodoplanes sp.]
MIQSFPAVRLPLGGKGRRRSDQHVEELRRIAFEIVMRACGFASLAIFCVMIGFSFEPRIAFESGGVLTLVMVGVLYLKAREARTKDYRRTEMWLYLPKEQRPPHPYAQYVSSTVLRETYLTFAYWTAMISIAMWALALIAVLLGVLAEPADQ